MRYIVLLITLTICCLQNYAQQNKLKQGVLIADTTWLEEVIPFPIRFAPEIKYDGYEDLRFGSSQVD